MSTPVALAALAEQTEAFGTTAYLITVGPNDQPHVVAVSVRWYDELLMVAAGPTTAANVERRSHTTMVWPAPPGAGYSLIVDGRARRLLDGAPGRGGGDGEATLVIEPGKAVLHRTPEGDPSAPSCITVLPRS